MRMQAKYELRFQYSTDNNRLTGAYGIVEQTNNLDALIQMMNYPNNYNDLYLINALSGWIYIFDTEKKRIIRPY